MEMPIRIHSQPDGSWYVDCNGCRSTIEFSYEDAIKSANGSGLFIPCPHCDHSVPFSAARQRGGASVAAAYSAPLESAEEGVGQTMSHQRYCLGLAAYHLRMAMPKVLEAADHMRASGNSSFEELVSLAREMARIEARLNPDPRPLLGTNPIEDSPRALCKVTDISYSGATESAEEAYQRTKDEAARSVYGEFERNNK